MSEINDNIMNMFAGRENLQTIDKVYELH